LFKKRYDAWVSHGCETNVNTFIHGIELYSQNDILKYFESIKQQKVSFNESILYLGQVIPTYIISAHNLISQYSQFLMTKTLSLSKKTLWLLHEINFQHCDKNIIAHSVVLNKVEYQNNINNNNNVVVVDIDDDDDDDDEPLLSRYYKEYNQNISKTLSDHDDNTREVIIIDLVINNKHRIELNDNHDNIISIDKLNNNINTISNLNSTISDCSDTDIHRVINDVIINEQEHEQKMNINNYADHESNIDTNLIHNITNGNIDINNDSNSISSLQIDEDKDSTINKVDEMLILLENVNVMLDHCVNDNNNKTNSDDVQNNQFTIDSTGTGKNSKAIDVLILASSVVDKRTRKYDKHVYEQNCRRTSERIKRQPNRFDNYQCKRQYKKQKIKQT
jgi:hypothetical protein